MIALPRKIQRFLIVNVIAIISILFIYQFTKLFIDVASDNYVANDYNSYRNGRYNNINTQSTKIHTKNSNTKYILNDSEFSKLLTKSLNTSILYISRHEGTISNFKYISEYLRWNLTIYSPESSGMQWSELQSCLMDNNCESKYERFCREYEYIIISDIMFDVVPFLKVSTCKAKIITEITNRFDVFLKDDYKTEFHKLFKNAIETKKIVVVVNNPYEIYYLCRSGIYVPHYALIRSTGYPPNIQEYDESLYYHSEEPKNTIAIISRSKQDSMLSVPALQALSVPYEVLNTRYGGPKILSKFKALLYLPYQVSVMAMMENLREKIIYLLPSPSMFKRLLETYEEYTFTESSVFLDQSSSSESGDDNDKTKSNKDNKNTDDEEVDNYIDSYIEDIEEYKEPIDDMNKRTEKEQKIKKKPIMENMLSRWVEWYREEFRDVFIYFEGFEELPIILNDLNNEDIINKKKDEIEKWVKEMERITMSQWLTIINSPYNNPLLNKLNSPVDDACKPL
ncbi:hypothetical protein LY90DRAFT_666811 [Neocallimastix californiae]|jgi:hypothetical protein|uniref:Uncharacterized protein n=1 Tax=Neocallimastix californiae TaxID=1754190 RepID=A0A1Y2EN21_9FUNG|nr:hypothetical protein LY90DRAFT_666811 [Neocallimastix californiae]|eukprot:ORY72961.1 hypothetical protein LY90DRAFT_666811 [Neocallimastix californiae]